MSSGRRPRIVIAATRPVDDQLRFATSAVAAFPCQRASAPLYEAMFRSCARHDHFAPAMTKGTRSARQMIPVSMRSELIADTMTNDIGDLLGYWDALFYRSNITDPTK
jgi:hypothetical protein